MRVLEALSTMVKLRHTDGWVPLPIHDMRTGRAGGATHDGTLAQVVFLAQVELSGSGSASPSSQVVGRNGCSEGNVLC
jgi:hypothetical protein